MGKIIYNITTSLDGYVADKAGNFNWTAPSEEVLAVVNDLLKDVRTFLMGRRLYETMAVWDTISPDGPSKGMNDFAKIWRASKKVIYSATLSNVTTANSRIERTFDPEVVQSLVAELAGDIDIGGPLLAGAAIKAGIVDEYSQFIAPVFLGGGNYWLPKDATGKLELSDVSKFENGFVHLSYRKA
jgi:dihydrofolate reductase